MRWLSLAEAGVWFEEIAMSVLFQVTLVAIIASIVILRLNSAVRHTVLVGVLFALVACPFLVVASRTFDTRMDVPLFAADVSPEAEFGDSAVEPVDSEGWMRLTTDRAASDALQPPVQLVSPIENTSELSRETIQAVVETSDPKTPTEWPELSERVLIWIWITGVLTCVLRFFWGAWWLTRLVKSSTAVSIEDVKLRTDYSAIAELLDAAPLPRILESNQVQVPSVTNCFNPVILLPEGTMRQLSPVELTALLSHEIAHVQRGDCFVGILQRVAGALYWFHPMVHWINLQLNISREEICDNFVLAITKPTDYASLLLKLGEQLTIPRHSIAMPLIPTSWKLEDRVKGLLDPNRNTRTQSTTSIRLLVALSIAVTVGFWSSARFVSYAIETGSSPSASSTDLYGDVIPYGGKVRIGTERFRPLGDGWHSSVAFSKDNRSIIKVTTDGRMSWWDPVTGKRQRATKFSLNARSFAFAPDRSTFAFTYFKFLERQATHQHGIQIRDLSTGDLVGDIVLDGRPDESKLLYTADGRNIIHAGGRAKIKIFDLALQEEMLDFQLPTRRRIDSIAVSPDGGLIVAASDRKLFLWKWLAGAAPEVLDGYERVSCMAFTPDGKSLALSYDYDKQVIEVLDLATKEVIKEFADPAMNQISAPSINFSSNGRLLIVPNSINLGTGSRKNSILVWELESGKLVHQLRCDSVPGKVSISADDRWVATAGEREIAVWNLEDGTRIAGELRSHSAIITGVQFTNDGERIVTASDDQTARIWDSSSGKQLGRLDCGKWIRGMAVSHDDRWIVTSSLDDTVCLWDAVSFKKIYQLAGHGALGGHRVVAFSPDSSTFSSFGDDGYLRIWDVATGKALLEESLSPDGASRQEDDPFGPMGHFDQGKAVFSPDAAQLLLMKRSASYLYDGLNGNVLKKISAGKEIVSACFSPDGKSLLLARAAMAPTTTPLKEGGVRQAGPRKFEVVLLGLQADHEKWTFGIDGRFGSIGFSPDGRFVALCQRGRPSDAVYLLDAINGAELAKIDKIEKVGWDSSDNRIAFTKNGQRLAVALQNTTVVLWDLKEMGVWK